MKKSSFCLLSLFALCSCAPREIGSFECSYNDAKGMVNAVYQYNKRDREVVWISSQSPGRKKTLEARRFPAYDTGDTLSWKDAELERDYYLNKNAMSLRLTAPNDTNIKDYVLACKNL
jgi:hypothetical protein